jgi:predicted Na+-dependent transporter
MGRVLESVRQNLLVLVIVAAIVLANLAPWAGVALASLHLSTVSFVCIFLLQGSGIDAREFLAGSGLARSFVAGIVIAHVLAPAFGCLLCTFTPLGDEDRVGFMIMCCSAPTIVSGVVIAVRAGGNRATALFLTVALNLIGVVAIPFNLRWTLRTVVAIDRGALLAKLVVLILVPSLAGMIVRARFPGPIRRIEGVRKHVPVVLLGLIVFMSLSAQAENLKRLTTGRVVFLVLPSLLVHGTLLAVAYLGSRYAIRLEEGKSRAVAVVCSQKSLPVAIAVWSSAFAAVYPLAVLAPIVFHPSQIFIDSLLSRFWPAPRVEGSGTEPPVPAQGRRCSG